jgi:hypothetical protein
MAGLCCGRCTTRVPQSGQNRQSIVRPLAEDRVQVLGALSVNENASRATSIEVPKALPDCRWHCVQ